MPFVVEKAWFETFLSRRIVRPSDQDLIVQKQGGEVLVLVRKKFRDFTIGINAGHKRRDSPRLFLLINSGSVPGAFTYKLGVCPRCFYFKFLNT
jgi:hypothetical protein